MRRYCGLGFVIFLLAIAGTARAESSDPVQTGGSDAVTSTNTTSSTDAIVPFHPPEKVTDTSTEKPAPQDPSVEKPVEPPPSDNGETEVTPPPPEEPGEPEIPEETPEEDKWWKGLEIGTRMLWIDLQDATKGRPFENSFVGSIYKLKAEQDTSPNRFFAQYWFCPYGALGASYDHARASTWDDEGTDGTIDLKGYAVYLAFRYPKSKHCNM